MGRGRRCAGSPAPPHRAAPRFRPGPRRRVVRPSPRRGRDGARRARGSAPDDPGAPPRPRGPWRGGPRGARGRGREEPARACAYRTMGMVLKTLDRYLLKELGPPFVLGAGVLTFFLVIDRVYDLTDLVITKNVPFHLVMGLLAFMLPAFLGLTLPMALLVAVLIVSGRMAADMEVAAFKASGVSPLRLFRPFVLAACVVSGAVAFITLIAAPAASGAFQNQLFQILQTKATTGIKERTFTASFNQMVMYVEDISASQVALRGLLVSDERDPKLSRIITAREGRLLTDELDRRITLRLLNGAVSEADVMPADPPKGLSKDATSGGAASAARYRYTLFGVYDLNLSVDSPLKGAPRIQKPEKDLTLAELAARVADLRADRHGRAPYLIELH